MPENAAAAGALGAASVVISNAVAAESASPVEPLKGTEEQCAVCWGILCEPVAWPGCSHYYCLVCALRVRQRPRPTCPLCRSSAPRARRAAELKVDTVRAGQVRRIVGYSRYELQRRELWVEAAAVDAQGGLGELPLFCMGTWHFPAGSHQRLRLFEPRYQEMIRRAMAPGGDRRFAIVLRPAEFEVGARGRVCEIVESEQGPDGEWLVVVEGGVAFQITEVKAEELHPGAPPLYRGALEEVEEEDLASNGEAWTPLVAANEMVAILGILGQHLRTMRRRRQPILYQGGETEETEGRGDRELLEVEEQLFPEARLRLPGLRAAGSNAGTEDAGSSAGPPPEHEDVGAMVNLLMAYRQIIGEMDRLLIQASRTAERLGLSDGDALAQAPGAASAAAAAFAAPVDSVEAESMPPSRASFRRHSPPSRQQRSPLANAVAGSFVGGGSDGAQRRSPSRQGSAGMVPRMVEAAAQTTSSSSASASGGGSRSAAAFDSRLEDFSSAVSAASASSSSAVGSTGGSTLRQGPQHQRSPSAMAALQESAMLVRSVDHGSASSSMHSPWAASTPASAPAGPPMSPSRVPLRSSALRTPATPTRRPSTPTWPGATPLGSSRRPTTPTRGPSTPSRSLLRTNRGPGEVGEERGLTQAEALRLRGSGVDWRSSFSVGEAGNGTSSMSDAQISPSSAGSQTSSGAGSGTRRARRPRQAVFSQAARFTFPGRRSNE